MRRVSARTNASNRSSLFLGGAVAAAKAVHLVGADHHLLDVCAAESADELAQPGTGRVDELVMAALTVKVVANIMPPCGLLRGACGPAMIFATRPLMVSLRGRA